MDAERLKQWANAVAIRCDSRLCVYSVFTLTSIVSYVAPYAMRAYSQRAIADAADLHAHLVAEVSDPSRCKSLQQCLAQLISIRSPYPIFALASNDIANVMIRYAVQYIEPYEFADLAESMKDYSAK